MEAQQFWTFTDKEKTLIRSILVKGKAEQEKNQKFAILTFDQFYKLFNSDEVAIMKKYLAIDPKAVGYKLPFLGLVDTPGDIVAIPNQAYRLDGKALQLPCQYLPKETYQAYGLLNKAIQEDINKKLLVLYGYRSPARQVFMFFDILERIYDFNFDKTVKRVCFPAYSEHVYPKQQAADFMTQDGIKGEGFEKTVEYQWLKKNAGKFGFFESYPRDNNLGMMFESWHWCYNPRATTAQ